MIKQEINKLLEIPISTLNDWQDESSSKHTLYQFLRATNANDVSNLLKKQYRHRIFHILNRNIDKKYAYTLEDVKSAFNCTNYDDATSKEQVVYSKFFKECDLEDLDSLITQLNVSIRNIKKIYLSSPLRKIKGVAEVWDKRFRVKSLVDTNIVIKTTIPSALENILVKRGLNV